MDDLKPKKKKKAPLTDASFIQNSILQTSGAMELEATNKAALKAQQSQQKIEEAEKIGIFDLCNVFLLF